MKLTNKLGFYHCELTILRLIRGGFSKNKEQQTYELPNVVPRSEEVDRIICFNLALLLTLELGFFPLEVRKLYISINIELVKVNNSNLISIHMYILIRI